MQPEYNPNWKLKEILHKIRTKKTAFIEKVQQKSPRRGGTLREIIWLKPLKRK